MSIDNNRMICDECGRFMGLVDIFDLVDLPDSHLKEKDECHNCRSRRLNREAKNEAKEST